MVEVAMYCHAAVSPCRAVSARGLVVATKWAGNRGPIAARGGRRAGPGTGAIQGATPTNTGQHNNTSMLLVLHKSHHKLTDLRLKVEIGNWMEDI